MKIHTLGGILFYCLIALKLYGGNIKNSANINIKSSTCVNINGNFTNETVNVSHGIIDNDGTIKLTGNWTNNVSDISNVVFTNLNASGTVEFAGTSLQTIGGTRSISFENLRVNNSGAGVTLNTDININNTLLMTSGDFDLRNNNVNLSTTGSLNSETSAKRIKATDGITDGRGTGIIYTTKTLGIGNYTNIAGLGLNINTVTNFGSTIIKRGHLQQQGTGTYSSNYSIYRYYEIIPTGKTVNYGTVTINYFPSVELNGHTDGQLVTYQSVNLGGSTYWTPLSTTNTSPQAVATTIANNLSNIIITCGSNSIPLPIELLDFSANCNNNSVSLEWSTASETNNSHFTIEHSTDAQQWEVIVIVNGAGNSNQPLQYSHIDTDVSNEGIYYYRLENTNFNGVTEYSNIISTDCSKNNFGIISIYPNPVINDKLHFKVCTEENTEINTSVSNVLGQILVMKKFNLEKGENHITLDVSTLSRAIYFLKISTINGFYKDCKQVLIEK